MSLSSLLMLFFMSGMAGVFFSGIGISRREPCVQEVFFMIYPFMYPS